MLSFSLKFEENLYKILKIQKDQMQLQMELNRKEMEYQKAKTELDHTRILLETGNRGNSLTNVLGLINVPKNIILPRPTY